MSTELPDETNVKGAFEGAAIVAPIIDKSPIDTLANDNVPDPSVFKNCPASPSEAGYDKPSSTTFPVPCGVILICEAQDVDYVVFNNSMKGGEKDGRK